MRMILMVMLTAWALAPGLSARLEANTQQQDSSGSHASPPRRVA